MSNPEVELAETMRVLNKGSQTLRLRWDSRTYDIAPGKDSYMPFDCVKLYFGDPRCTALMQSVTDTRGLVSFVGDRATEVRRLRLLYNAPFGELLDDDASGSIFQDKFQPQTPGQ